MSTKSRSLNPKPDFLNLLQKFSDSFDSLKINPKHHGFLLALSGGVDSVMLAHMAVYSGFKGCLAHVNFGLRAQESDLDEQFVRRLAENLKLPIEILNLKNEFKKLPGESTQMAARRIRYDWFEQLCAEKGLDYILVGHHSNDQVETFFINLLRGSGSRGLSGMSLKSGNLIRPLLWSSREEIIAGAKAEGVSWREDSSNNKDVYLRNKIRHTLIPAIESIDPLFVQKLPETFLRLKQERSLLDFFLEKERNQLNFPSADGFTIAKTKLETYPNPAFLLYELSRQYGFSYVNCSQACQNLTNSAQKWFFSKGFTLSVERAVIRVYQGVTGKSEVISPDFSSIIIEYLAETPDLSEKFNKNEAWVDASKLTHELTIRTWKKADYFYPSGMKGRKLLSDLFTDIKLTQKEKNSQLLLMSGEEVVWVVNRRIDRRFAASHDTISFIRIVSSDKKPGEPE
jgi:tRNA(Ile)-lysidine synthase